MNRTILDADCRYAAQPMPTPMLEQVGRWYAATLARALEGIKLSADGKAVERRQGLGLPLARRLVEAHGGTLELLSEPGQGTAAIIDLP
mgnify:CR=1 FL=1